MAAAMVACTHSPAHRASFVTDQLMSGNMTSDDSCAHILCMHGYKGSWAEFCREPAARVGLRLYMYDATATPRLCAVKLPEPVQQAEYSTTRSGSAINTGTSDAPSHRVIVVKSDGTLVYGGDDGGTPAFSVDMFRARDFVVCNTAFDTESTPQLVRISSKRAEGAKPTPIRVDRAFIVNPTSDIQIDGYMLHYHAELGRLFDVEVECTPSS
ncbi:Hypothetical protein UVM_LOCUS457 [uncultured virus]|nr:Hypothetical protein UVM_LOCUS457 [uncultured virus]